MTAELIRKYALPVPRYTSYPTAPHFSRMVDVSRYEAWLRDLKADASLSLYAHIPFCETLCWYCGCTTKATRKYEPIRAYLRTLINEISRVTQLLPQSHIVRQIHWGGGSPNILQPADLLRLSDALRAYFNVADDAEFAVEVDPRTQTRARTKALAEAGLTRVSVGVQDFDTDVQIAINREQSFEKTRSVIEDFRNCGVGSVNVDLVYGLPFQTISKAEATLAQVLRLAPDRIALFGYAHLPARIRHQKMIDTSQLPDTAARFAQSQRLAERLVEAGYVRVGLDHFARPSDPLVKLKARRNFQGYTVDGCDALIGLGASAIGKLPQGYVQNATSTHAYTRSVRDDGLATVRGHSFTEDDRMRAYAIERIMCDLAFPAFELLRRYGETASPLLQTASALLKNDSDRLLLADPDGLGFKIAERGRPFIRTIAAQFDAYLERDKILYSVGV